MASSRPEDRMNPNWIRQRMIEMEIERDPPLNRSYRCYSGTYLKDFYLNADQAAKLEAGDKIFMPPSALGILSPLNLPIMLFQLRNPKAADRELVSHCGVLEFIAEEDTIYMPSWKMRSLQLEEGDAVHVKIAFLPKGRFVKFQPHTTSFLDITNPRAVLEKTLRTFTCFTTGDTIMLPYNGKEYYVDIVETKPPRGISIVDTDCEVDFVAPLDYKEPEKPVAAASPPTNKAALVAPDQVEEPKFSPFTGAGRRLDGKPLPPPPISSSSFVAAASNGKGDAQLSSTGSSSQGTSGRAHGKLVFGTNNAAANRATNSTNSQKEIEKKASKEQAKPEKKEPPKFQPFTGKGYSLKG
ncbi:PREDICTED: ubiquitin fusion degradation protein 1 homolog [Fragaria vesca subsp. vesca]|uniref:ubiquitin fusion degradation protein 1 homolog n=1 Tax=Fragaria vesca subsp. vesca TaxID=101020 RepID=UPI0002C36727|nr:PREDICTED: ubiquitin fusion degradation protein 1 homolog [Fragaria vesca subsp. vesca]XP_011465063.1 PREDICTED: ubiquitin fusion degradation protein 1 homolog [Fragaria vesca subsp. vesca]